MNMQERRRMLNALMASQASQPRFASVDFAGTPALQALGAEREDIERRRRRLFEPQVAKSQQELFPTLATALVGRFQRNEEEGDRSALLDQLVPTEELDTEPTVNLGGDAASLDGAPEAPSTIYPNNSEMISALDQSPSRDLLERIRSVTPKTEAGRNLQQQIITNTQMQEAAAKREAQLLEEKRQAAFVEAGIRSSTGSGSRPGTPTTPKEFVRDDGSIGLFNFQQQADGTWLRIDLGDAVEDNNEGSQSTLLSLYKEQTRLEEMLVDMNNRNVSANDPERLRLANRLDVLKTIIDKDAMKRFAGAYYEMGGKEKAPRDALDYKQAQDAVNNLERDENLIRLLHKGKATTGFAANWIQTLNKTVNFFKDDPRLAEGISDTELVDVLTGEQVFPLIQALGIGARGMDTPAEREFMRKVLTGTLTLTKDTLLHMARMRQKQSRGAIKNWNTRVDRGEVADYLKINNISKENSRIQDPYSDQNQIAAINEMNLEQVTEYSHPGLSKKVKEAVLARIRALK
tara:strand:+ start:271 stop:1824 length:1554 start_codon:yes stop_codon:yes gene_type:complete